MSNNVNPTSHTTLLQIAIDVHFDPGANSHFMVTLANAYILAYKENRALLRPSWIAILKKHGLIEGPLTTLKKTLAHARNIEEDHR